MKTLAIAGAGFAGAVLANLLCKDYKIVVFEERDHIGGNCHSSRDKETGVMVHHYGPHIFHTSREDVWEYVNRFGQFRPYTNRVKAVTKRGVFSLPLNLLTINQFFGKNFSPAEAKEYLGSIGDQSITEPKNFEEQALRFLGRDLYETFFYGYTKKQWGVEPTELPASILQRLPVRFNYDDAYFTCKYQAMPVDGYTSIIEKMLDHPNIRVVLGEPYLPEYKKDFAHVFYSGPLDTYFGHKLGRLGYRSLKFERFTGEGDIQGYAVVNYCEASVPYTRISEHKHFAPWENHEKSVAFREYSKLAEEGDTLYYPLRLANDKSLLKSYMDLAEKEEGVTFIGRMGTYRYLDMHVVIGESLDLGKVCQSKDSKEWPRFSAPPLT